MRLYHATLKTNLNSIREFGLNPEFSQGAEKVIWMHTACRREWAILHVQKRHKCSLDDVVVIEVSIPRSKLRRRWRGLWTTSETITEFVEIHAGVTYAGSPPVVDPQSPSTHPPTTAIATCFDSVAHHGNKGACIQRLH